MSDQADRWRAFSMLDDINPVDLARRECISVAAASIVLEDPDTHVRYVRIGWFESHVRQQSGPGDTRAIVRQMTTLGWKRSGRRGLIKATSPGRAGMIVRSFLQVPQGWENG
jgi:hypothetical protein